MNTPPPPTTVKDQLDVVEKSVQRLLDLVERLSSENSELKKREKSLMQECVALRQRNDKAAMQLETLISRFKQSRESA